MRRRRCDRRHSPVESASRPMRSWRSPA